MLLINTIHCMLLQYGTGPTWTSADSQAYSKYVPKPHSHSSHTHTPLTAPRNGRPCTCLAWNPTEAHLVNLSYTAYIYFLFVASSALHLLFICCLLQLAEGLERSRNDNSLVVWDIERASSPDIPTTPSSTTRSEFNYIVLYMVYPDP